MSFWGKISKWMFGIENKEDYERFKRNANESVTGWTYKDWGKVVMWGVLFFLVFYMIFWVNERMLLCRPLNCFGLEGGDKNCTNGSWLSDCENKLMIKQGISGNHNLFNISEINESCKKPDGIIDYGDYIRFYDGMYMSSISCKYNIRLGWNNIKERFINLSNIKLV